MDAPATRADWERLPEGAPFELIDGLLVRQPSPRFGHQRIQAAILQHLLALVGPSRAIPGPADVLVDEWNVFAPDVVVLRDVPDDEAAYVGVPLLVFEVLSPSTAARDRGPKLRALLALGVEEVWLVDRHARTIEVVDTEGRRLARGPQAVRSGVLPGLDLVPDEFFA